MKINRREFVGGIAAVVVGANLPSFAKVKGGSKQIDVYFHGLWVIVAGSNGIAAYAPTDPDHCYMIGRAPGNIVNLAPSSSVHSFDHQPVPGSGQFNASQNLIQPMPAGAQQTLDAMSYKISLPTPTVVNSYRIGTADFAQGKAAHQAAMVQRLQYRFDSDAAVSLSGTNWTSAQGVANDKVHIFAEPPICTSTHPLQALNAVSSQLHLGWTLTGGIRPGLPQNDDQKSLCELGVSCTSTKTSKPKYHVMTPTSVGCCGIILGG